MFSPIRTERLLIRAVTAADAADLAARRSDPDVAKYQNWTIPYPLERAENMVAEIAALDGPTNDEWWMGIVCDPTSGEVYGDVVTNLSQEGRTAEIGYTFFSRYWGRGYAVEATEALLAYLFETVGVTRVFGMLHPDNPASAMVMERCGLLCEGHTPRPGAIAASPSRVRRPGRPSLPGPTPAHPRRGRRPRVGRPAAGPRAARGSRRR